MGRPGQPLAEASRVTLDYKAPLAAAIMVLMIACMMFDFIPIAPVTAVMIAAVLMVLTGCLRNVEAADKTHQLGKHRTDRGDAADVRRAGKKRERRSCSRDSSPKDWAATDRSFCSQASISPPR